ncbi:MAG TPA: hypothetical protein VGF18_07570 [Candidatus Tumulicola sp.]|jgi:hypothetical protein
MFATFASARADVRYHLTGQDVYGIGSGVQVSSVRYTGEQQLSVRHDGGRVWYTVRATYTRYESDDASAHTATFEQASRADGSLENERDDDPDFLTILNQPFAISLDRATLHDLRSLRAPVPFDAGSPLGDGAVMHGYLRPAGNGSVAGRPVIAIVFDAQGTMDGPIPGKSDTRMAGRMHMNGTAYYATGNALLLELDATLRVDANLSASGASPTPVKIVYRRTIRAEAPH